MYVALLFVLVCVMGIRVSTSFRDYCVVIVLVKTIVIVLVVVIVIVLAMILVAVMKGGIAPCAFLG